MKSATVVVEQPSKTTFGGQVLRAVPCGLHESYTTGCPDCLTGEQAQKLAHPALVVEHGFLMDVEGA